MKKNFKSIHKKYLSEKMKKGTKPIGNTRQRVLESASAIFAKKGYRDATIAEICERAPANVASVNYYFKDKKHLYNQVWQHTYKLASEAYPLDVGVSDETSDDQRLLAFISGMLRRMGSKDPTGYFSRLVANEMADPPRRTHPFLVNSLRLKKICLRKLFQNF